MIHKENTQMTEKQKQIRNQLAQDNFDHYLWNNRHMPDDFLLWPLVNAGFTRSAATKALTFIKNQTVKALKECGRL